MKKFTIILIILIIPIFCTNKNQKRDHKDSAITFFLLNNLFRLGNIQFVRKDNLLTNTNSSRFYNLKNITKGDGNSDGYIDNFLTPTGMYLIIVGIAGWKSPENGGAPYGEENWWNTDTKVSFFSGFNSGTIINLKRDADRYWLSSEFKEISSKYDRLGFILASVKYLFSYKQVADPRLRVLDITLTSGYTDFPYTIFQYKPQEIENNLYNNLSNGFTWYDYFLENAGLIQAITNIEISPKCNSMIENGFLIEYYGSSSWYSCLVNEEHDPYAQTHPINFSPIRLDLSKTFLKTDCIADEYISNGLCSFFEIYEKGQGSKYLKVSDLVETISGEENPDIIKYITNKNGLVIINIPEEDRKNLDNSNKIITFEIDASNIFFWDSDSEKTIFDPSVDRPNPSIGKDLKIYLPRISVQVE